MMTKVRAVTVVTGLKKNIVIRTWLSLIRLLARRVLITNAVRMSLMYRVVNVAVVSSTRVILVV